MCADEKGVQVFALYGVGDGTEATPLYAVGGKKAIQAEKRLQERMREFERHDGDGETVDSLLESIRSEKRRSDGNIAAYGNGEAAKRAAELYGGQQDRNAGDAAGRGAADQRGVTEQTGEESTLYLERDPEAVDNRTLLANALESAVQNETVVNLVHGAYCKTSMGKGEERIVMTSTEKKLVEDRLKKISERLAAQYREVLIDGHKFFAAIDDSLFRVSVFPGEMALVIEYADSAEGAKENALEDGDRFYLDKMDFETMVRSMAAEIEGL